MASSQPSYRDTVPLNNNSSRNHNRNISKTNSNNRTKEESAVATTKSTALSEIL
jgi:hypothetical protein